MNNNYYGIILAGGVGSRFWPVSTTAFPKQFHDILGTGQTLIQKTYNRLTQLIPSENILVLTNSRYTDLVLKQLPTLKAHQVVNEPAMRNTAPSVLYAALKINKINPDASMIIAPSDHWIENEAAFVSSLEQAFEFSYKENILLTFGIKPTFPNTGYGYIEYQKTAAEPIKPVIQFREKPNYDTAKSFIEQGNFLWNAGIFVWSAKSILKAFKQHQSNLFSQLNAGLDSYNTTNEATFIKEHYPLVENISIDYAIMEPSKNVFVLPASFDWNDLGTWGSLYDKLEKTDANNAIVNAKTLLSNSEGNIIRSPKGKIIVIDGLNDFIVVDDHEVLLIIPKKKEQSIKQILNQVKAKFGDELG